MERSEVYKIIDEERDYQEWRWPRPAHNHSITEYLVYMRHYVNKALDKVSTSDGDKVALEDVRKIAALAVACMEENGAVGRMEKRFQDYGVQENYPR